MPTRRRTYERGKSVNSLKNAERLNGFSVFALLSPKQSCQLRLNGSNGSAALDTTEHREIRWKSDDDYARWSRHWRCLHRLSNVITDDG